MTQATHLDKTPFCEKVKLVGTASIGGGLEMYDFVIYIFFAPIIASLFFPKTSSLSGLLATYGIFAIGYLAKPLGAFIFGHYGDTQGRKQGLMVTMLIMGFSTISIGLLPTYQQIGMAAPILLLILRLLQGTAMGGDMPGAITFVSEHADISQRGLYCAWVFFGVNMGILLASGFGTLLTHVLPHATLVAWGWRVAFLFSIVLLPIGFYFRRQMIESPIYSELSQAKQLAKVPALRLFKTLDIRTLVIGIGLVWLFAVSVIQLYLYMPNYLHQHLHIQIDHALMINTASLLVYTCLVPVMGHLSDVIGRKRMLIFSAVGFVFLTYPLYIMLASGNVIMQIVAFLIFAILTAVVPGVVPATLSELFISECRYSGVGLVYNISSALFAGCTPGFVTWLIYKTGNPLSLSYNLIFAAIMALISLLLFQERRSIALDAIKARC